MRIGVVDIGTNSMRLLISEDGQDVVRVAEVTGLGVGVDATGRLSESAIERTVEVLAGFGERMDARDVSVRRAIATSAARDAANREAFLSEAAKVLGVRPELISGDEEARLAWLGARSGLDYPGPAVVCDIGGGSTELVSEDWRHSVDIGSVRLGDRLLPDRPASQSQLAAARAHVAGLLEGLDVDGARQMVGVAGTWTSLGAIAMGLPTYQPEKVHGYRLQAEALHGLAESLGSKTVEETAAIPSLDPKRAPVLLAGAVVASEVVKAVGSRDVVISERDTLDGVAAEVLALA